MQPVRGIYQKLYLGVVRQPDAPFEQYLFVRTDEPPAQSHVRCRFTQQFWEVAEGV